MEPLAIKMRPKDINDIIGQHHLLDKGKPLRNLIENKYLFSMILYGKPGIGKTTIGLAIADTLNVKYKVLNAVINSKKDFDIAVEEAKLYNGIIIIMDEIHRLNKDKQDLLLPYLESGLITLIGLTTSNPYHSINPAIRSRCQIFELKELSTEDVIYGLNKAVKSNYLENIKITKNVLNKIAALSNGDLRYAYNLLEFSYYASTDKKITLDLIKEINAKPNISIDKNEDGYYDVISAFQKSIRGSDVNAALHYLARLIESGDLDIIFRRMTVIAYEDIGLANPMMGPKVEAAIKACERLGLPEGRIPLGNIVIEMALSPKSNSGHIALDKALNDIKIGKIGAIPNNIRQKAIGYLYPHDYPNSWVKQQYLPNNLKGIKYYYPKLTSKYEISLKNIYDKINKSNN